MCGHAIAASSSSCDVVTSGGVRCFMRNLLATVLHGAREPVAPWSGRPSRGPIIAPRSRSTPEQKGIVERLFRSLKEKCGWQQALPSFVEARRAVRRRIRWSQRAAFAQGARLSPPAPISGARNFNGWLIWNDRRQGPTAGPNLGRSMWAAFQ